ncbi:hypothetical protein N7450_010405, partial [Penicillium hetheringtonii]
VICSISTYSPVDSSQANLNTTQHGNDLEDGAVSGPLLHEETRDSPVAGSTVPTLNHPSLSEDGATPPSPAQRVIEHENAGSPRRRDTGFRVVKPSSHSQVPMESLPNEVLTHILSHLPPHTLSAMTLVSRRFHSLVTTPHAWRVAFSRFFPGPQALEPARLATSDETELVSDRRYFARLTALASWRSEYILRTRLMRSLGRGKPAQFQPSKKHGTVRSATARNGIRFMGHFPSDKEPTFIHGASEQGIASASDPSMVKVSTWGLSDHQMFRHFADIFPGDAPYGLGAGEMAGVPNSIDVSQPYGMIYGEGCPQGRSYFISTTEQRGRFLSASDLGSHPHLGIPAVNQITHAVCSPSHLRFLGQPGGLVAMMSGSSSGVLTAYAMGPHPTYEGRFERGQVTAKWVLSPGVPIIGIAVDDNYSPKRHSQRRIWAVVLNALGEVFYLADIPPKPDDSSSVKLNAEQLDELAWKTGRTVRWELVELSRRKARPDPFSRELVDGSYSPRSSSVCMHLDVNQIAAETREIEKFLSFKPKHFRKVCEGWNMKRDVQVDFAGSDGNGSGESIIVIARGGDEVEKASVRRYFRTVSKSGPTSTPPTPDSRPLGKKPHVSLFGGPTGSSGSTPGESLPASRLSARLAEPAAVINTEWRISDFTFDDRKSVEITTNALDNSMFSTVTAEEDPLFGMSGSSLSSATSSPMLPHMEQPRSSVEIPGQRARYLAVGTATGMVFIWNIRALAAQNVDVINSIPPLRVIQTESPQVSCLALTSLYLVHGGNDGLVQAWDPLASSTRPIRTLNSRFSSRARRRLVQAEASMFGVGNNYFATGAICLDPDPTNLRGMVSLGTHLRYWSYSSSAADQYNTSKRRLRHGLRGSNGAAEGQRFNNSGRGAIRDFIEDERVELERQQIADAKERVHLSTRFGVDLLGPDVDEDQLLAYAQLLSQEAHPEAAKQTDQHAIASSAPSTSFSDTVGPSSFGIGEVSSSSSPYQQSADDDGDDDLAEAIRLSLLGDDTAAPPSQLTPSIPIKYAKGVKPPTQSHETAESSQQQEIDDLEFAIQLSLAENKSRGDVDQEDEWEEFPSLAPPPISTPQSSGKGKGKARVV